MHGYVSRSTRVMRFLALLFCAGIGILAIMTGLTILFLVRASGWGVLITIAGAGLLALAISKRNRWHAVENSLTW